MTRKAKLIIYILINLSLLLLIPFMRLYNLATARFPFLMGCGMHDIFRLYCPFCGGTRAITELIELDFAGMLHANAIVPIFIVMFIYLDILALVAIIKHKHNKNIFYSFFSRKMGIVTLALVIVYFLMRNILLVFFKIDPLGDLLPFYI